MGAKNKEEACGLGGSMEDKVEEGERGEAMSVPQEISLVKN